VDTPLRDLRRVALLVGGVVRRGHVVQLLGRGARDHLPHVHHEGVDAGGTVHATSYRSSGELLEMAVGRLERRRKLDQQESAMLTDAELWKIASEARIRADAGEREAKDEPSLEAQAKWMKARAESE